MNTIPNRQSEYKQLAEYLYYNLNKDFKRFYRSNKNTCAAAKACTGLSTLSYDELEDRKVSFIAYCLPALVEAGTNISSYKKSQSTVLNSYRNMMIDIWRKQQTERKHIVHLETIYSEDGEDMTPTNNIPDTTAPYNYSIDKLWLHWARFVGTLSTEGKILSLHWFPTRTIEERSMSTIAKDLGISKRQVQSKIEKLRSSFLTYIENARAEEDINVDEELLGINMEKN